MRAHGPAHAIVAHSLGAKAAALAVARGAHAERLVFLAPIGDFSWYLIFSLIATVLDRASSMACIAAWTGG